ncbi:MAG: RND efflux system, inner membrane transporter [Firmicutes bacterium]|nr:RND efflux system, inner membrane transporter [Bacillota bacterium]
MKISDISINRPVTTIMCVLIVILLGVVSLGNIALDLLPNISIPVAVVSIDYSGAGPREVESLVTQPLESILGTVANVKSISSTSSEGNSTVIVQFNDGTDMDFAALNIREKVDLVKAYLPADTGTPFILKLDPTMMAIMQLSVSNGGDEVSLKNVVEDEVAPRLERVPGVASVSYEGGLTRELRVEVYTEKLNGYGLSLGQIVQSLRTENLNLPGGSVDDGNKRYILRTTGEFQSIAEIENIPISLPSGGIIRLKDVADVRDTYKEVTSEISTNGKPSMMIDIRKESTANTVQVARRIHKELDNLRKEFADLDIVTIVDTSTYIEKAIGNVANIAVLGGFLAIAVLYLFLRNFRTTFIIGVAIPISIIATFSLIYFNGLTLNMMSLGGLALGVGMLVDNSIVVLENIFRYRQEGYGRIDAAREGSSEIAMAVVASTLTTIAVFAPIVFVQGIAAQLFRELALTVTFSLVASLIVALTLVPMLSSKMLRIEKESGKPRKFRWVSNVLDLWNKGFDRLDRRYRGVLAWVLGHRKTTVIALVLLFVVSLASVALVGAEFFPSMDGGYITVNINLPKGTVLEETTYTCNQVERILRDIPEMEDILVATGYGGGMTFGSNADTSSAMIWGKLKPLSERKRSSFEVADEIRAKVAVIPGAEISVASMSMMSFGGTGDPISIRIKGDDLDELAAISEDVKEIVQSVEGTRETTSSLDEGKPELRIRVDRNRASRYGLNATTIASTLQTAVEGQVATKYRVGGDEIDIRVVMKKEGWSGINDLNNLTVASPMGYQVPLSEVAEVVIGEGPETINRVDQVRVVTVSSGIFGRDLAGVMRDIQARLTEYPLPSGYVIEYGGENQEMVESFQDLALALMLAVVLVYMIMASQFESLVYPFIIMFSVPFAFTGALGGLAITGRTFNLPAFIGIIMLSGIVVNNAIVLVDYINTLRSRGMDRNEAILKAGPVRLRPILMTALTTILGLMPMAIGIGEGTEAQAPLATAVIGGLAFSTVLTLVVIPVMYTLVDDFGKKVSRKVFRGRKVEAESDISS